MKKTIPFNIPYTSQESALHIEDLIYNPHLINVKHYTKLCEKYFEELYPNYKALMTPSCTKALELIAISLDFKNGDEVIMPSFNFVGVANAFVLHGATPIFADLNSDTMNISPDSIRIAITPKTKAVLVMHYAGLGCQMDEILEICQQHNLVLIEDNAQGIHCRYNKQLLGSFGDFSTISFDGMKNISCSEGGVLLYKEKYHYKISNTYNIGTNREEFEKGIVSHYEWVSKGSKFYMSEYNAAALYPLLLESEAICKQRRLVWDTMFNLFSTDNTLKKLLPLKYKDLEHYGHIFWIKCKDELERNALIEYLFLNKIFSNFHYSPLHTSLFFKASDFKKTLNPITTEEHKKLLRLPMYNELTDENIAFIFEKLLAFYK